MECLGARCRLLGQNREATGCSSQYWGLSMQAEDAPSVPFAWRLDTGRSRWLVIFMVQNGLLTRVEIVVVTLAFLDLAEYAMVRRVLPSPY